MEIISYVGASSAKRVGSNFFPKIHFPVFKNLRRTRAFELASHERRLPRIYPLLVLKKLGKYFWVLPLFTAIALVPYGTNKAFSLMQERTNPLPLRTESVDEMGFLQEAMSQFALSTGEDIDDDGNIGGVVSTAVVHDKVSYTNYTVKTGDTIGGITNKFGLKNISTIIAVNGIENVRQVYSGQKLRIPSFDGLIHTVTSGNSLEGISAKYGIAVEDILDANDLDSTVLAAGQKLFIPGAKLDRNALRKAMGETWASPLKAKWRLTSKCAWRPDPFTGVQQYHPGIDMACPTGTPIYATMGGKVLASGVSRVYGNYIIIDHGNGYQTLYGHLSKRISVVGEQVSQNQKIGLVGSTGYSTGPHLHFTVYKNGKVVDPQTLLGK